MKPPKPCAPIPAATKSTQENSASIKGTPATDEPAMLSPGITPAMFMNNTVKKDCGDNPVIATCIFFAHNGFRNAFRDKNLKDIPSMTAPYLEPALPDAHKGKKPAKQGQHYQTHQHNPVQFKGSTGKRNHRGEEFINGRCLETALRYQGG